VRPELQLASPAPTASKNRRRGGLLPLFPLLMKNLTLHGYQYKEIVRDGQKLERAKRFILDGLASGVLKPIIDKTFPFERIVDAHRYLESNQQFGKIVVTM